MPIEIPKNMRQIQVEEMPGIKIEVLQYNELKGSGDIDTANKVFLANQAKIHLKIVRITLNDSEVTIEPGALYFMRGSLKLESDLQGGATKSLIRKLTTGETLFQSKIKGTGEIYLEPTFGYYSLLNIDDDSIIFNKGAFCCASKNIAVGSKLQGNISSAIFGGKGFFQPEAKGSGIIVLNCPVPEEEMITYDLRNGEKLSVDGNFAFVRTGSVTFQAEKSGKSLFSSVTSGEGLLQTFTGPGLVWLAPTQVVYDRMKEMGATSDMAESNGSMGSNV